MVISNPETAARLGGGGREFYAGGAFVAKRESTSAAILRPCSDFCARRALAFGHNLDPNVEFDRQFVDALWQTNRSTDQSPSINGAHSGTWYDPSRSGEGFQFEIGRLGETRRIIANWQTYRDGRQMWLTGSAILPDGCSTVSLPMLATDGANFGSAFRPGDVRLLPWGNITLGLVGAGRLELRYDADTGEHATLMLQRMLDGIEGLPAV